MFKRHSGTLKGQVRHLIEALDEYIVVQNTIGKFEATSIPFSAIKHVKAYLFYLQNQKKEIDECFLDVVEKNEELGDTAQEAPLFLFWRHNPAQDMFRGHVNRVHLLWLNTIKESFFKRGGRALAGFIEINVTKKPNLTKLEVPSEEWETTTRVQDVLEKWCDMMNTLAAEIRCGADEEGAEPACISRGIKSRLSIWREVQEKADLLNEKVNELKHRRHHPDVNRGVLDLGTEAVAEALRMRLNINLKAEKEYYKFDCDNNPDTGTDEEFRALYSKEKALMDRQLRVIIEKGMLDPEKAEELRANWATVEQHSAKAFSESIKGLNRMDDVVDSFASRLPRTTFWQRVGAFLGGAFAVLGYCKMVVKSAQKFNNDLGSLKKILKKTDFSTMNVDAFFGQLFDKLKGIMRECTGDSSKYQELKRGLLEFNRIACGLLKADVLKEDQFVPCRRNLNNFTNELKKLSYTGEVDRYLLTNDSIFARWREGWQGLRSSTVSEEYLEKLRVLMTRNLWTQ